MKEIYNRQVNFQKHMKSNSDVMYKALVEEIGEWVASFGYADWKETERDEENILVEAMDICIFAMNLCYYDYVPFWSTTSFDKDSKTKTADIYLVKNVNKLLSLNKYADIVYYLFSNYPELKSRIICKQALNTFRQDNGYKIGKYTKIWNGKEDNVTAMELIEADPELSFEDLYTALDERYSCIQ